MTVGLISEFIRHLLCKYRWRKFSIVGGRFMRPSKQRPLINIILKNAKSSIFGVKFDFSREMNDILKSRDGNEELVGCS